MILQQLVRDSDRLVDLPPSMYDAKPVKWLVSLTAAGEYDGINPTSGGGKRDKGQVRLVPFKNRAGIKAPPLLLADKVSFTWGLPEDDQRIAAEHARYLDLLAECAAETGNADVAAVLIYLRNWRTHTLSFPAMEPDELTTFCVDGRFPIEDPAVRRFWARKAGGDDDEGVRGRCLACGENTRIARRLPVVIHGVRNGHAKGIAIVSGEVKAAESFGQREALGASICRECGERFGKAANALLKDRNTHLQIGTVAYLFWARESEWSVAELLDNPQPETVRLLLTSPRSGEPPAPGDDADFYAVAISAAISRAVVRSWLHTTVGNVRHNMMRWFELQRITDAYGKPGKPLSVFRLVASLYRDADDIPKGLTESLCWLALQGGRLPRWLLHQAVLRNRVAGLPDSGREGASAYARIALITAVLRSASPADAFTKKGYEEMSELQGEEPPVAYRWGQLLAVLEMAQRRALERRGHPINSTIVDRYYGAASSAPGTVFGRLMSGAQDHLKKIRGPLKRGNLAEALQRRIEELSALIDPVRGVRGTLTIKEQAAFALGYYHERARLRSEPIIATENHDGHNEEKEESDERN